MFGPEEMININLLTYIAIKLLKFKSEKLLGNNFQQQKGISRYKMIDIDHISCEVFLEIILFIIILD